MVSRSKRRFAPKCNSRARGSFRLRGFRRCNCTLHRNPETEVMSFNRRGARCAFKCAGTASAFLVENPHISTSSASAAGSSGREQLVGTEVLHRLIAVEGE